MERESYRPPEVAPEIANANTLDSGTQILGSDPTLNPRQAEVPRRSVSEDRRTTADKLAVSRQIEHAKRAVALDREAEKNRILQDSSELFFGKPSFGDLMYRLDNLSKQGVIDLPMAGKPESIFSLMHKVSEARDFAFKCAEAAAKGEPLRMSDAERFFDTIGILDVNFRACMKEAILNTKPVAKETKGKLDWSSWWDEKTGTEKK